jgi:hypothetical protein
MALPSLRTTLQGLTVAQLKGTIRRLREPAPKGPKATLVDFLHRKLKGKTVVKSLVAGLDSLDRHALAEAVYHGKGWLDLDRFHAKYGAKPEGFGPTSFHPNQGETSNLMLLVYGSYPHLYVPRELLALLRPLLERPEPASIQAVEKLPGTVNRRRLTIHLSDEVATRELGPILRLVQQGGVKLTSRKRQPTKDGQARVAECLVDGDHYPDKRAPSYRRAGAIRSFAWPQLLQAGKLATIDGDRLALTTAGRKALGRTPADTLQRLWKAWLKWKRFDEFGRIDFIRGQHHGPGGLTEVTSRREAVVRALAECPPGEWVTVNDFLRFMQVEGHAFEVCHDPWELYVEDRRHGSLGHRGFHGWNVLQKRYVMAFLFEYAATLGLVDLACIHPAAAEIDHELWGADCLPYLSRYDGLQYFRVNALGAWCLGQAGRPARARSGGGLRVLPSLQVKAVKRRVDPHVEMMLDTWAQREGDGCWRLDQARILQAMENGLDIVAFRDFLNNQETQPLPEPIEALLQFCCRQADAVRPQEPAFIYRCRDEETCRVICEHPEMHDLCQPLDTKQLVVATRNEARFRETLRVIGFGLDMND